MLNEPSKIKEQELIKAIGQLSTLLRQHGVADWAFRLDDCANELQRVTTMPARALVVGRIHLMYGGMCSLSDLYITAENGHSVLPDDESRANQVLRELCSRLWNLTQDVLT